MTSACSRSATRSPPDPEPRVGLYHLAWEVGTLADLADARERLRAAGALVGQSDHRVSKSLYAKDPDLTGPELTVTDLRQAWAHRR